MVFNFRPHRLPPQRTSMAYQIIANRDELSKNLPPSFTETAPTEEQNSFKSAKRWFGDSISTWRATSSIGCGIATFVFVFNVIILIWACATSEIIDGIAIVYRGTLLKSRTIGVTAHLVINILSSLILVSSNKCVQYLSSPTRRDVNKAHAHRSWVDIGIRSLRNFKAVRGWRMWVSILLAVSSLPLHLMYEQSLSQVLSTSHE